MAARSGLHFPHGERRFFERFATEAEAGTYLSWRRSGSANSDTPSSDRRVISFTLSDVDGAEQPTETALG